MASSARPYCIYWIRAALRLRDNRALTRSLQLGRLIPVLVWDPGSPGCEERCVPRPDTEAAFWFSTSVVSLSASFAARGSRLILRKGASADLLLELVRESGAKHVVTEKRTEPAELAVDARLARMLEAANCSFETVSDELLTEPGSLGRAPDQPFRIFPPFGKRVYASLQQAKLLPRPNRLTPVPKRLASLSLSEFRSLASSARCPRYGRDELGEQRAQKRLRTVIQHSVTAQAELADLARAGQRELLSPALRFGELSIRQVHRDFARACQKLGVDFDWRHPFLRGLLTREFAKHLLIGHPTLPTKPLRPRFEDFPWRRDARGFRAWKQGNTGFPIVDAGMRQLSHEAWMPAKARWIVASFLCRDLRVAWQEGARFFMDRLADADLACNSVAWQWAIGAAADTSPWFRILNPYLQGRRFDPSGEYVRQQIPDLAELDASWIHRPSKASAERIRTAGFRLGTQYPREILAHDRARIEALQAMQLATERYAKRSRKSGTRKKRKRR